MPPPAPPPLPIPHNVRPRQCGLVILPFAWSLPSQGWEDTTSLIGAQVSLSLASVVVGLLETSHPLLNVWV